MNTNNRILLGISLLLTTIFLSIRLLIRYNNPELSEILIITYKDIAVRGIFIFTCTYILLVNATRAKAWSMKELFIYNLTIAMVFAASMILVIKYLIVDTFVLGKGAFMAILSYTILVGIVQLIAAYTHSNQQKLQIAIEKEQIEKEKLRIELNALKAQLNPHFLFNALNTLNGLYRISPEKAIRYNEQLSGMFRYLLEKRDVSLVPLVEEIKFVEQYLELYKTRFGDNLKTTIQIPQEQLQTQIPSLCLQVLIENAIKHNEISKQCLLHLRIQYREDTLIITNNINPKQVAVERTGLGLANLQRRFELLLKQRIKITKKEGYFTVVLPLKNMS